MIRRLSARLHLGGERGDLRVREHRTASGLALGGAVGTLSGLGAAGPAVRDALAARLGLASGPSWHSRRDTIAGLGAAVGIAIGAVGKLARDVALLMQPEIGEVAETAIAGGGGSSAMPHNATPPAVRSRYRPRSARPASSPRCSAACRRSSSATWAAGRPRRR